MDTKKRNNRIVYSKELKHHGIIGQQWGVRNGPPYPLDRRTSTGKRLIKDDVEVGTSKQSCQHDRDWKEVIIPHGYDDFGGKTEMQNVADYIKEMENGDAEYNWLYHKYTNDYGGHNFENIGETNCYKNVNSFVYGQPGTMNNCAKCAAALEMQRRGYNVAAGRSDAGTFFSEAEYWFDGAVQYKEVTSDFDKRLDSFGRNSSAMLAFRYPNNSGGHAMYAYTSKQNEKFIMDGQCGRLFKYDNNSGKYICIEADERVSANGINTYNGHYSKVVGRDLFDIYGYDTDATCRVTRLDNATPNYDHMSEDSVLRTSFVRQENQGLYNSKQKRKAGTW